MCRITLNGNDGMSGEHEDEHKRKKPAFSSRLFEYGRRERIRTSDPLVPNQLRYQAALLADFLLL